MKNCKPSKNVSRHGIHVIAPGELPTESRSQENDDDGFGSSGSWLDLPTDARTCEWCSAPDYMRNQLPRYVNVPLDKWPPDLLLDLCYCYDCVQEYHRLQEESNDESKKLLHLVDIDRLAKTITNALENVGERKELQEVATKLQVPLLEILRFPYLLHDERLADLFKRGLIALNVCGCPLKLEELEEKIPGTYLLLVHPDPEVRGWAVRSVRGQGFINQDDYDVLKEVIGWMIQVVEFDLFKNSDLLPPESKPFECMFLPCHLFMPLTIREYWLGLFVLLRQMDVETMQSCFMSFTGHIEFLNTIVSPMAENEEWSEDDGAFWPRFQCFVVLLDRLGNRIWQISGYKPYQLFTIITENNFFHNAIMQWRNNEGEGAFSEEVFGDLQRTRQLSSSSDTKYCSKFYKTTLAWFQPFVKSLIDFESHGDCLSLVIKYLHNLADDCSHESTFKLDVQSALLRIIHELLAKRMFELLAPTVNIWAEDVLNAVIFELGDKKMVDITRRLLQNLLKAGHRLGYRNALKFWQKFQLPGGPKQLSSDDKKQIISLLVQTLQAQNDPAFQNVRSSFGTKAPVVHSSGGTKAPTVHASGSTKAPVVHSSGTAKASTGHSSDNSKAPVVPSSFGTKVPAVHSGDSTKASTDYSSDSAKTPTAHSSDSSKDPVARLSFGTKAPVVLLGDGAKASTVYSSGSAKAPTVHSSESSKAPVARLSFGTKAPVVHSGDSTKASTVYSSGSAKAPRVYSSESSKPPVARSSFSIKASVVPSSGSTKAPTVVSKAERQKSKDKMDTKLFHQSSIQIQGIRPLKEMKLQGLQGMSGSKRLAIEKSGTPPQQNIRSLEKPGPSTHFTSSEDEEDEEVYWNKRKRRKKPKHPSGKVRVSKSSLRMGGSPIQARVHLKDCMASVSKITAEKNIKKEAIQRTPRPKKTHRARKSAGVTKKYTAIQQNSGATSEDPIVLSDEDESAAKLPEQKQPMSAGNKDTGILDDYFYCDNSENDDVVLVQHMDEFESPSNAVKSNSIIENRIADKLLMNADDSSENTVSDEELLHSYTEIKDNNSSKGESVKANLSGENDSSDDDKPLSYVRKALKTSYTKKPTTDIAPQVKTEEIVDCKASPFNEVINAASPGTSTRERDFPEIKTEVDRNMSSFTEENDIQGEVDYFMDGKEEKFENESGGMEWDAEPTLQTVKTESTAQGKETTSLSDISKNLLNDAIVDDGTNFWGDYCGYSELVLNSQENALASVEEDLEDLYSTQTENWKENTNILSSTDSNDKAVPNEVSQTVTTKKHVTFAIDSSTADAVASSSRSSVGHAAITQPSRALSEDEFFHEILSWKTERLCNVLSNGRVANLPRNYFADPVPNSFESIDQYYNTFKPLLFMEIWEQAISSWRDKDVNKKRVAMNVLDGSTANSFWIIPCSGVINEHQHRKTFFPMESDLVLLTLAAGDEGGGSNEYSGRAVFGFVEKAEVKRIQQSQRVSIGSSGGDDESTEAKFQLKLDIKTTSHFRPVRNCRIQVEFVTSLLTALRQWTGLMQLSKSILATDILRPRKTDYFCSNDYSQSAHVAKEYNESQEKVISTAANAVHKPFPIPRICLVQGPPGTGKSYTIVGLVKEILNRAQEMPAQMPAGPSNGSLANKVRILLCAPSNAAIDELIGRINEAQIQLEKRQDNRENRRFNRQDAVKSAFSTNCGDLCLVRVGRKSHIHQSVMKFSLESMSKQVLEKKSAATTEDEINKIKEKLKTIHNKEKKLEHEIWKLKTLPQPKQYELQEREKEKAELINHKNLLEMQWRNEKDKQANKRRVEARIRRDILNHADVICTTLSGAGSTSLKQDLAGRRVCPFTCVIVDEACQSKELELLIPLWFHASKLVLVGDPEQLPSTVLSETAKEKLFGRSMFSRLYRFFRHEKDMKKPVLMLEEQYRMHPEIAAFPSSHVYDNFLKSHSSLEKRPFPLAKHYALFDVVRGREISQDRGALWNPAEVKLIVNLCRGLARILHVESIGIITPYRKQKGEIQNRLKDENLSVGDATIEVNTVDGFQGREKDVIILSCVRAQTYRGSIGFLSDRQRMNVALTRARHALYVFGHMETLKGGSTDWNALVEDAKKRHCLFDVESPAEVRLVLSIGPSNNIQSPAKDPRLQTKHISAQVSDSHSNSSRGNDHAVQQMDRPRDGSCSTSAEEINEGKVMPVSRDERQSSVTAEEMVHVTAAEMANDASHLVRQNSTGSEPFPSTGQVDSRAAESRRKIVNSTHIDKQEQEKRDWERTRHRDRFHKQTREGQRHRPRTDDRRYDDRHHGNRDSRKRDQNHRPIHKHEDRNEAAKKSNGTHREPSRHHLPHRDFNRDRDHDRDRDRDRGRYGRDRDRNSHHDRYRDCNRDCRDRDRGEGSARHGRQMQPGQSKTRPETSVRYTPATTTTTSSDKNVVFNAVEMNSNNTLDTDTRDVYLNSVVENNARHPYEYFMKLHQQEQQLAKTRTPPSETGQSPVDVRTSPYEPAVTSASNPGTFAGSWQPTSSTFSSAAPRPSTPNATHTNSPLQTFLGAAASPGETGWSPAESDWSPAEIEWSPIETRTSPNETAVTRPLNQGVSTRVETAVTKASNPGVPTRILRPTSSSATTTSLATQTSNPGVPTRISQPTSSPATTTSLTTQTSNPGVPTRISRPTSSPVTTTSLATQTSNPGVPIRVSRPTSSSSSLAASWPSTSNATHPNALIHRTHGAAASSSSFTSQLSNSFDGRQPLDRRSSSSTLLGELDSGAQRAADLVRQRHPPAQGPPIISPTSDLGRWNPHGGSRKRKAHVVTSDVSSLRERANREGSSPPKRAALDPTRRNSLNNLKKMQEKSFRGRKNWK